MVFRGVASRHRESASGIECFLTGLQRLPGWSAYVQGDLRAAYGRIGVRLQNDQDCGRGWELLGLILRDLGKPKSAVAALENASLLTALHPLSQILLTEGYAQIGKPELAKELYLSRLDLDGDRPEILLLIAAGLEAIDQPHLALEVCRRAGKRAPELGQQAYDMSFYAARCGLQLSLVESLARRAVELEPDNVHFRIGFSSLLVKLKRDRQAHSIVASLTRQQIGQVRCKCCLERIGKLFATFGDRQRAYQCVARLEQLHQANLADNEK